MREIITKYKLRMKLSVMYVCLVLRGSFNRNATILPYSWYRVRTTDCRLQTTDSSVEVETETEVERM